MDQKRRSNVLVGSPVERLEDLRFLRGRGQFVDDLVHDNLLHAVVLRSAVAHGHIRSIDTSAALARPGVHAVITAADIGPTVLTIPLRQESAPEFKPYEQPVIAHGKVRYVGEPIALVLAENAAAAEDALDAIAVDIESLPAIVDSDSARKDNVLLFEKAGSNHALTLTGVRGDADAAFKTAAYVRRERFKVQRHGRGRMYPSPDYEGWKRNADVLAMAQGFARNREMIRGPFKIDIAVAPSRMDLGNVEKALTDWCQSRQLIENDKYCSQICITRVASINAPEGVRLTLMEL